MSDPRATLSELAAQCSSALPLPPGAADVPVFAEPWQAQAFAMAVQLHAKGVFTWPQWAHALSQTIAQAGAAGDPDDGSGYYQHWVDALEHLVLAHNLGTAEQIHRLEHAWEAAAARTPHGQPIEVQAQDFSPHTST